MNFTNTQAQVFLTHVTALRESLAAKPKGRPNYDSGHSEILASLINECGPQICSASAEAVALSRHTLNDCCPEDIDCICETLDKIEDVIQASLKNNIPPDASFRDLIAKLIEKLGPFLIQALIGFLLRPQPPKRIKYCNLS